MESSKIGFKPLDAGSFVSIMDNTEDNIELFNRDSYFGAADTNQGWLWFLEQSRLQHYRAKRRWTNVLTLLFGVFFFAALLFLMLAMKSSSGDHLTSSAADELNQLSEPYLHHLEQCLLVSPNERVDCNPDPPISKEVCASRGCCWLPTGDLSEEKAVLNQSSKALPPLNVPYCFFGVEYRGYNLSQVKTTTAGRGGSVAYLHRLQPSGFLRDVQKVKLEVTELSGSVLRVKLTDSAAKRYEVPFPQLNLPQRTEEGIREQSKYSVQLRPETSTLTVYRAATKTALFHLNLKQLIYSDQFIQVTSKLPTEYIYGIGENRSPFRKYTSWKRYTLFARDQWPLPDKALYGSHPFYLASDGTDDGSLHGVFLFNSNAMDIITQPAPAITYRTVGGVLDFFLFLGPTAEEVLEQYHTLIGLPAMPSFWSLGFHLSRFGYQNLTNLEATYQRTKQAAIPYDVQWTDIDLFQANNDFTYDHKRFERMPEFIGRLHHEGRRFVPMFDCGISAGESPPDSYLPFKEGLEMDVFVKNSSDGLFIGRVWNSRGRTVWPDFTHPNATQYWTRQFAAYHELIHFDGSWIDMNEPSNFLDGDAFTGCPWENTLESPQYTPGMTDDQLRLSHKTLCMTAKQSAGLHYNLHNLYGLSEAMVTNSALKTVLKRRPFILSRSTAPGHGHYAAHWDGDIFSEWDSMKWSISSILNFNLFGVPLVGADICGFNGNTTVELCARWHQLGAFYSFSRNHNTDDAIDQDPVALGPLVEEAARQSLRLRYAHLAYLYSLFSKVARGGGSVLRPLLFEFPTDLKAAACSDSQFMWGSAMMVAPALRLASTWADVYFPPGTWYHAVNYTRVDSASGHFLRQPAGFQAPNVYYRAGSVVPLQAPKSTTDLTRVGNFTLVLALDSPSGTASGGLYWDDGDGLDTYELGLYNQYQFSVANNVLDIWSLHLGYETAQTFDELLIFGFSQLPSEVLANGIPVNWSFANGTRTVHVHSLAFPLTSNSTTRNSPVRYSVEWKM